MTRLVLVASSVLAVAFAIDVGPPILQGFHFGCNSDDTVKMTRVAFVFCKAEPAAGIIPAQATTSTPTSTTSTTDAATTGSPPTPFDPRLPVACLEGSCSQGRISAPSPIAGVICGDGLQWLDAGTDPRSGAGLYRCKAPTS